MTYEVNVDTKLSVPIMSVRIYKPNSNKFRVVDAIIDTGASAFSWIGKPEVLLEYSDNTNKIAYARTVSDDRVENILMCSDIEFLKLGDNKSALHFRNCHIGLKKELFDKAMKNKKSNKKIDLDTEDNYGASLLIPFSLLVNFKFSFDRNNRDVLFKMERQSSNVSFNVNYKNGMLESVTVFSSISDETQKSSRGKRIEVEEVDLDFGPHTL